MKCREYIEAIYRNPRIDKLIRQIKPVELQEDLKQEMAMVLLSYDCDKIIKIHEEGDLMGLALMIIYRMGNFKKSYFYKKYKQTNETKLNDYIRVNEYSVIPLDIVDIAKTILNKKLVQDANNAHESMIFTKYVEMRSCTKVAEYFGIPHLHVFNVVKKMKLELKKAINNQ